MKKVIHKFHLEEMDEVIELPRDSEILKFDVQNNNHYIWVLLNPDKPKEKRRFRTFMTGEEFQDKEILWQYKDGSRADISNHKYIGSTIGFLAFHLFEIRG